jgi:methylmalonyl-CoA mutase cobalamin-binding subunit
MRFDPDGPILPADLPDGRDLVAEGRRLGNELTMGVSLLCREHGVRSELAYRRKMHAEGRLMTSMNLGMQTWADTAEALRRIHDETGRRGFRIDRYNMNADRRMGLPPELWGQAAKETGPMLETPEDWRATAETVPIQPGLGDMMIGTPMSVANACRAIQAGVNNVGNMSQFNWRYPGWPGDDVEQMVEMVKALGVMAAHVDDDAMVSSYLDDGFCAQFDDYCSYIGWALFERTIVDQLVGARLSISYGGLTRSPIVKTAMVLALESIKPDGTLNSAYYGDTTAYTADIETNHAVLVTDMLYLILAQLRCRSGVAVVPTPVTEAVRAPTWQEIVEVHAITRRIAEQADELMDSIDWPHIEALSERLVAGGRRFHDNIMAGFAELGIDMADPLQILLAARRMGPRDIEARYAAGDVPRAEADGVQPLIPTDTYRDLAARRSRIHAAFSARATPKTQQIKPVVGSTDIHEYALDLMVEALRALDIEPIVAGVDVDPDTFAELARRHGATAVLISTHNGMALDYAERLQRELQAHDLAIPIVMGGRLNQDRPDAPAPVDVSDDLARLGIHVCDDIDGLLAALRIGN